MLPVHTILCPLDFSDPSEKAIQIATEMAAHFQAELLFVHVIPPDVPNTIPADPAFAFPGPEPFQHTLTLNAQKRLEAVAQRIPSTVKSRGVIGGRRQDFIPEQQMFFPDSPSSLATVPSPKVVLVPVHPA